MKDIQLMQMFPIVFIACNLGLLFSDLQVSRWVNEITVLMLGKRLPPWHTMRNADQFCRLTT